MEGCMKPGLIDAFQGCPVYDAQAIELDCGAKFGICATGYSMDGFRVRRAIGFERGGLMRAITVLRKWASDGR